MGLVTEIVPAGRHVDRALEIAEALARFPQDTMLADRRAAIEGIGLTFEEGLALEAESSGPTQAHRLGRRRPLLWWRGKGRRRLRRVVPLRKLTQLKRTPSQRTCGSFEKSFRVAAG